LDDLAEGSQRTPQTELRNVLGSFLFSEDDVFKRIGVLSGGERNRYALAKMLLTPSNFLLLDEPTNHLDMRAKDVLLEALEKFTGTVVFVSHDRYFLEQLANRVFEVAGGEVHVFPGNFVDYLWRKQGGAEKAPTLDDVFIGTPPAQPIAMPSPASNAPGKRINPIKLKQMEQQSKQLEDKIAVLEAEIQKGELRLSDFVGADEALRLSNLLTVQRSDLEIAMEEWERLTQEMEVTA
jgi:ATP-binding cassette subfamily F protein 3